MSAQSIVELMKKHYSLHESLLNLSKNKTEALKDDDLDAMQSLLVQERKHIQGITQVEEKRLELVADWYRKYAPQVDEQTVSHMLTLMDDNEEKQALVELFENFVSVLTQLKEQEQLNKDLTEQSLQFVDMSLDMIQPNVNTMNYGNQSGQAQDNEESNRSMFDSKA